MITGASYHSFPYKLKDKQSRERHKKKGEA